MAWQGAGEGATGRELALSGERARDRDGDRESQRELNLGQGHPSRERSLGVVTDQDI